VKYALDTNLFIDAFRDPTAEAALLRFLEGALPFTFLSAVVMQELAAGARKVRSNPRTRSSRVSTLRQTPARLRPDRRRVHSEWQAARGDGIP
jgi:predicted nucleic acid-binding protein